MQFNIFTKLKNHWFKGRPLSSPAQPVPTDAVCLEDRVLYSAVPFELPAEPVDWSDASELAQYSLDADDLQRLEFVQPGEPAVTLSLIESLIQDYDTVGTDFGADLAADQVQNLVFINYDVDQIDQLISDFSDRGPEYQVFVLDDQSNGVDQITNILGSYSDLASVHLISHGSGGQVNLGNSTLSLAELDQHEDQLSSWRSHLNDDADILVYGCELAATEDGQQLIETLAELTQADIAASDDLTGHTSLGGDWILEYAVGDVNAEFVVSEEVQQSWSGVLSATESGSIIDVNSQLAETQETNSTGGQAIATNDAGVSVVVWQSKKQDVPAAGDYGVFAQILDVNGNPIGPEIAVNDYVAKDQMSPAVAIADDGSFIVVWASEDQDGNGFEIYGMRFDALGNPLQVPGELPGTFEFRVNDYVFDDQIDPAVAMDGSGNFVVTWTSTTDQAGANSKNDIYFRRFDAAGNALDITDVLVNTQISFDQYDSSVDMNDSGEFVVTWTANNNQDSDGLGVYAQKFDASGATIGTEILVNTETTNDQYDAAVAIADSGEFVVVWTGQNHSLDGSNDGIIAQLFATNATMIGGELLVNSGNTAGNQANASVDMMADGQFVVTWTDVTPKIIYYQEFSAVGTAQDQVIQVDTDDTIDQQNSSISVRDNGDFIVVWTGNGSPTFDTEGVFAQQFAFDNEAPWVDLPGTPLTYYENDPPLFIDAAAIVSDVDSANFNDGRLIVDFLAGGTANDRLAINNEGIAAGEIGVAGSNVTYGGLVIGTFTGGVGSTPLVITLNSNATVAAVQALSRNITYQDLPNDPDTSDRTVRFILHDGDGGTSDPVTQIISITLVNDAPDIQGITSKTIVEDGIIQFQNADLISITDVDADTGELQVTLSVSDGVINLNSTNNLTFYEGTADGESYLVFSGDLAAINNALDGMEYDPTPLYVGTDQLVIHVDDLGNTGAGGALTDDHIVDITINADAVNDAPRNIKPANQTIIEDDQLVFSSENGNQLWIQDDSGAAIIRVTLEILNGGLPATDAIMTLADPGLLTFIEGNGVDDSRMVFTGTLDDINAALDGLLFEPNTGFTGQLEISIFTEDLGAQGSGGAKSATNEIRVDIDERNDPPVITAPDNTALTEGTPFVFNAGNSIIITDPDATGVIQVSLDVQHGILSLGTTTGLNFVSGADDTASMTIKASQAEIAAALTNLTYTPDVNFAGPDNLQITVDDLGGVGAGGAQADANTIELTINPDGTNSDPINTIPGNQNTDEETPIELSTGNGNAILITDDAGTEQIQVTIEVNDGTLTLSNTVGSEFDVNNFVTGDQESPQVAIDENGNYIVVWQSNGQDGSGLGIYAQLFNAEGISTGPEFLVNESTAGHQQDPSVDMDRNGNFVIVWTGKGDAGADSKAVYARLFDANGNDLSGGEILVNQTTAGDQTTPAVAMNWQTGDFVVTWQTKDQIDEWDIFARQFSFDLLTIGSEFQVNDSTTKKQTDPSIDINDSGDFIIGWTSNILGDENLEVLYRRFDSTGTAIDLVDETASDNSTKNQRNTTVAIDNSGNYVVAWESQDQDYVDGKYGVYAQIWDNTGTEIRNEFVVNDTLPKDQINAQISMDGNGDFIISWQSESTEKDVNFEVFAKRFDITGTAQGGEFLVNLTANKDQANPDVALNGNGDFVVVWQSKGQDAGDSQGIYGQMYRDFNSLNFIEGDGVNDARMVFEGTLDQINDVLDGLVYTPNADFVGTDTLTITTDDQHATDPRFDVDSFDIIVGPVNDAPVISIPSLQTILQDNALTFDVGTNEISISDVDAGTTVQSVTVIANHGTITLFDVGGLVTLTGNGTNLITLSGTLANINAALDGMQFDPTTSFAGSASIFLRVDDPGEPIAGDELSAAQTVLIQVDPDGINELPVILLPNPQRTDKNVELFLDESSGNSVSINDDSGSGIIEVSLTVTNGTITLSDGATGDVFEYVVQTGNQTDPGVGLFADGSYVMVWESPNQDGNGSGIVAQRFSTDGYAMGDEFVVNSFVTGNQVNAAVSASAGGNFVVTWESPQDGAGLGVYGQVFDNAGNPIGDEFIINSTTAGEQRFVDVAMADDGSFVAVWQSSGNLDGNGEGIFAQRFDAFGVTLGDEFQINTTTIGNQTAPAIALNGSTGEFVVVWQDDDNNNEGIFAQRFASDGSPIGNQFLVNTTTLDNQTNPDVAMDNAGNFVITWESNNEDGSGKSVVARIYDAAGLPQGSGFIVNDFVAGDQEAPAVAMNAATGEFVITWQSANQDGNGDAVVGQRFDAAGNQVGSEFVLNSDPTGNQTAPAVDMNASGEIVTAFVGQDANQEGVFVKKLLPNNAIQFIAGDGINDTLITIRGTLDDINAALDGLRFDPTVDFEGVATVQLSVNDLGNSGTGGPYMDSNVLNILVGNAPALDLDANNSSGSGSSFETNFVPGSGPVNIADLDTLIDDPDDGNMDSLTVSISNLLDGANELLSADVSGTLITVDSFIGGVLTLSGTDSIANYQLVLSRITYDNVAGTPTLTDRILEVVVNDGTEDSNIAYSTILYPNAPTDIAPDISSVDENIDTSSGYSVGTLTTADADIVDTFTYTILAGLDGAFFSVGGGSLDELILTNGVLDFESKATYSVNVQTEDSQGYTYSETLTVSVNDLNEAPAITSNGGGATASINVAENTTAVTFVTAADEDVPADTLTYTISGGADAALFTLNASTGELEFIAAKDFETFADANLDGVYEVQVTVDDGNSLNDVQDISVTVTNANEAPVITSDGGGATAAINVAENTTAVTFVTATDEDVPADTLTYTITGGADAALFTLNSSTGELEFIAGQDFETFADANSDGVSEVQVTVDDGNSLNDVQDITVTITDTNEAPVITSNGGGATAAINVAENTTAVTFVTATDEDVPADTLTYTISGGADAALFTINGSTGELEFIATKDFETFADANLDGVYEVQVTVDDGNSLNDVQDISVTVTDQNDAPIINSDGGGTTAAINVAEGLTTITDVDASDADVPADTLGYNISGGADSALFTINSSTGQLDFITAKDFETLEDADMDGVYEVQVTVDDGSDSDVQDLSVTVTDQNDAPILDNSADMQLTTLIKDDFSSGGNTVAEIVASASGDRITDADGDPEGIAVTGFDNSNGIWEYSTDGGTFWNSFASVVPPIDGNNAIVLDASAKIRFVPTPGFTGPAGAITFQAWDGTDGSLNGATGVDAALSGGQTAFSTSIETATIDVVETLVANTDNYTINEDQTLTVGGNGVLGNDDVHFHDITSGALLNYQANFPGSTAGFWEDMTNVPGFDLDATGEIYNPTPVDNTPGVVSSYIYDGTGGSLSSVGLETFTGDPTDGSATFEVWFRPDDQVGKEIIFETGGWNANESGLSLSLWGGDLYLSAYYDNGSFWDGTFISADISSLLTVGPGEPIPFVQASFTLEYVDADADTFTDDLSFQLFVNGSLQSTGTLLNALPNWSQGELFALGDGFSSYGTPAGGFGGLEGEIGIFRLYDSLLTGAQIQQNYDAVATLTVVPPTDTVTANGVAITVNPDGSFVYNSGTMYNSLAVGESAADSFTYTAQDSLGNTHSATVNINIDGVNDDPTVDTAILDDSTNEDELFTLDISSNFDDDDTSDVLAYSAQLTGPSPLPGWLSFNTTTGAFSGTPANGDVGTYTIEVTADDGHGGTVATDTFDLTVVNVNDAPVINNDGGGPTAAVNTAENTVFVTTVTATDADVPVDTLSFSIVGGADQLLFEIDAVTGVLDFKVAPDFEVRADANGDGLYEVQVRVDDGNVTNNNDTQTIFVTVTDVNEGPDITSDGGLATASINVAENTTVVTTVTADDEDVPADTLNYNITGGADSTLFSINSSTGELIFIAAKDFETFEDADLNGIYEVQVTVDDGSLLNDVQDISVTVTDINEAPDITSDGGGATASINVAENTTAVTFVTATDEDVPADTLTYSITGGADAALFTLNGSTGELEFVADQDFETFADADLDGVYEVQVTVDDGNSLNDVQDISVTITDDNEAPVITSHAGATSAFVNVVENTTAVTTITATDEDTPADTLTYTITGGADAAHFNINSSTGDLAFVSASNFEVPTDADPDGIYEVEITVDDGNSNTDIQTVVATITDDNDAPVITSNGGGSTAAINVVENTTVVTTVTAVEQDPTDLLAFSISGGVDAGLFSINSLTGELSFISPRDFETLTDADFDGVYEVEVTVEDGNSGTDTQAIAVTITDAGENPIITSNGGAAAATINVNENTSTVTTVTATDVDDFPLTYSISGGTDAGLFAINSTTGQLNFITAPDFESPTDFGGDNTYEVDVQVTDAINLFDIQSISVNVQPINDNTPIFSSPAAVAIAENTTSVVTVNANDVDDPGDTVTYSIVGGDDASLFTINSATGALSFLSGPDFETPLDLDSDNVYEVIVRADDGVSLTADQTINVTITPVNEADPTFTSPATQSSAENVVPSFIVSAVDSDNPAAVTYSLSGNPATDNSLFVINPTTGVVTGVSAANFEAPTDADADNFYLIEVIANDGFGRTASQLITLEIVDVPEPPVVGADAFTVDEGATHNSPSGQLLLNDSEPDGLGLTASVVTGPAHGSLIVLADGTFSYVHNGSETISDSFVYQATSATGLSTSSLVTITVNPVQDPTIVADDNFVVTTDDPITISAASVLSNDFDADSGTLIVTPVLGSEVGGTVSVDGAGNLIFTPTTSFTGTASFSYIVDADGETSAPATVFIDVLAAVPPPTTPDPDPDPVTIDPDDDDDDSLIAPPSSTGAAPKTADDAPNSGSSITTENFVLQTVNSLAGGQEEQTDLSELAETSFFFVSVDMRDRGDNSESLDSLYQGSLDFVTMAGWLWSDLDELNNRMSAVGSLASFWSVATPSLTTTISVGYVMWLIKGGQIMAGLMAQVPAWKLIAIDPLPILRSVDEEEEDVEGDSLASMVDGAKSNDSDSSPVIDSISSDANNPLELAVHAPASPWDQE